MTDRFITKQRRQAESHDVGRVCARYDFRGEEFVRTTYRAPAGKQPPLNPVHAVPVGRGGGVCKPGDEYPVRGSSEPPGLAGIPLATAVKTTKRR